MPPHLIFDEILGMRVAVLSRAHAVDLVASWAGTPFGHYICVANVHMCMESFDQSSFCAVVNGADLVVPDGLPLVWAQQMLGNRSARQVRGEDLTRDVCAMAQERHLPIGVFGGTPDLLVQLRTALLTQYPSLKIDYSDSPPFRQLTQEENRKYAQAINDSGIKILFVGLGCPKQEIWMAAQRHSVAVVMIGVGAAFDFISGSKRAAPLWMQAYGLEWLFRLGAEPRRLWKRYLRHNPRFIWYFGRQLLRQRIRIRS